MKDQINYRKIRFALGVISLIIGLCATNIALFNWVEQAGLSYLLGSYARYACAYGGLGAIITGAMLVNDFWNLKSYETGIQSKSHENITPIQTAQKMPSATVTPAIEEPMQGVSEPPIFESKIALNLMKIRIVDPASAKPFAQRLRSLGARLFFLTDFNQEHYLVLEGGNEILAGSDEVPYILSVERTLSDIQDKVNSIHANLHEVHAQKNLSSDENVQITTILSEDTREDHLVPNECCTHHFGYLNKSYNAEEIPEQCLTCSRTIECMLSKEESEATKEIRKWYK